MDDIGIIAVGGYNEMGRNMTALHVGKDIVIFDMGLRLDQVQIHEDVEVERMHSLDLIKLGAIPDDTVLKGVDGTVRAIVCTHGHLDHIGAISKLAHRYRAPIIATPYTIGLIKQLIKAERKFNAENELVPMNAGETKEISSNLSIEFIRVQHSTIDCVFIALHTPRGALLYANDFKMDRTPTLGKPPDIQRLKQLGKEGVFLMITESTNAGITGKTPSERIAKDMLHDVLVGTEETESGIIVTTFSSHIARINAIVEIAKKMDRIPVLMGRSMDKYVKLAKRMGYIKFPDNLKVYGTRKTVDKAFARIASEGKEKYLPIVTGHQGEPGAVLERISMDGTDYRIETGDKVIFSANVIPTPSTRANRHALETKLRMRGARIYDGVHVSGHACREDHWELLRIINPEHVIPAHGNLVMHSSYIEMAEDTGYVLGDTVHLLRNGEELTLG
ncbi:MAG TPA: RNase J family beta-CASP ribonuclease [Methanosarcinales archaeon]|nr:RNase J family beta-CASP ribonuclease [Methanosarcinales archaeon]